MERSPSCHIYFATTGSWTDETVLLTRADQGVADLKATDFSRRHLLFRSMRLRSRSFIEI